MTYWNVISMVYAVKTARWMDGGVLYDIGNWIHATLTPQFDLDTSKKEKSGLFVEDLDLILHYHYVRDDHVYAHERLRVQLALILIIAGATTTRPDALIGKVLYEDIEFQLLPPGRGGKRCRLGLVVNLVHVKKSAGVSEKKVFGFHEEDTLLHDPVLHMLSLAFADGAFLNEFSSPEQIYEMVVPAHTDRLKIPWKEEWRGRPIFRDVDGLKVSLEKALKYCKTRGDLIRLGRALGYAKRLEFYDIRRGSGKKLNEALTPEERNKAMGHRLGDSSTYVRYYMTDFIGADTQAIAFGSDPQTDFVNLMSRLVRHGNAPTKLTEEQKDEIANDPKLVKYLRKRSQAMARFKKQGYPSYTAAKKAGVAKHYEKYRKRVESLRKTLSAKRLERAISEFHETIYAKEIDQQLQGIKPSELLAPSTIQYELEERAEVARLFSQAADVSSREELFKLRMKLIPALTRLCKRRESPRRPQATRKSAKADSQASTQPINDQPHSSSQLELDVKHDTPTGVTVPKTPGSQRASWTCPFCRWRDLEVGEEQRQRKWRVDSLARHIRSQHLRKIEMPFNCPYGDCRAILGTDQHFANHAARGHGDHYPASIILM
ncbi:hypothetical protein B0T10DRAFT_580175 [Thelonectria olida]|uniref:C2H2-type domain-containing protein n=1 Tax=Thelonectria olida TaxID=1576542 RepID=A0A9P9ALY2_9HYPO|nr:hypothetical protein B0T10DRAFT_580175 [Thelonectria olida]